MGFVYGQLASFTRRRGDELRSVTADAVVMSLVA